MTTPAPASWHVADPTLEDYVAGRAQPVVGASVEAHVLHCPECRARLALVVPRQPLERAWESIREQVESPDTGWVERALRRLGLSVESAHLLAAVPAMREAWMLGVFAVTVFAGVAALFAGDLGLSLFLVCAPLLPVAGVAACFGGDADPAHELVTVTPHSALRLLLLRTAGVLATSVPLTALIGIALPGPAWIGAAWLLPAATGVLLTLALGPLYGFTPTAATLSACWTAAVLYANRLGDPLEAVEPAVQVALAATAVLALAVLFIRYPSLDRLGGHS